MDEQSIQHTSVYKGRIIKLDLHTVRLPNGKQSQRELVTHPGAVAIVALDEQKNILLVRQFRFAAGKVLLEIPAGTREPNEDVAVCAERELREETGYKPRFLTPLGGIFVAPGYTTEYIHLFFTDAIDHAPLSMDDDEFIEVERVSIPDAIAMIERGDIQDGKSVAGILRVARHLGV
jgi:ADP-ribose pyrophosphatase